MSAPVTGTPVGTYIEQKIATSYKLDDKQTTPIKNFALHQLDSGFTKFVYDFVQFFKGIFGYSDEQKSYKTIYDAVVKQVRARPLEPILIDESVNADKSERVSGVSDGKLLQQFAAETARNILALFKSNREITESKISSLNEQARTALKTYHLFKGSKDNGPSSADMIWLDATASSTLSLAQNLGLPEDGEWPEIAEIWKKTFEASKSTGKDRFVAGLEATKTVVTPLVGRFNILPNP